MQQSCSHVLFFFRQVQGADHLVDHLEGAFVVLQEGFDQTDAEIGNCTVAQVKVQPGIIIDHDREPVDGRVGDEVLLEACAAGEAAIDAVQAIIIV